MTVSWYWRTTVLCAFLLWPCATALSSASAIPLAGASLSKGSAANSVASAPGTAQLDRVKAQCRDNTACVVHTFLEAKTLTPTVSTSLRLYLTKLPLTKFHLLLQSTLLSVYKSQSWSTVQFEATDYEILSDASVCQRNLILCAFKKNRGELVEPILIRLSQGLDSEAMSSRSKCDLLASTNYFRPRRSASVPNGLFGNADSQKPSDIAIDNSLSDEISTNQARRKSSPSILGWKLPCAISRQLSPHRFDQAYTALVYQLAKDIAAEITLDWASSNSISGVADGYRVLEKAFQSDPKLVLQLKTQHAVWSLELMWHSVAMQIQMEKSAQRLISSDCALAYQYHYCTGMFLLDAHQEFNKYIKECPREPYFRQAQSELEHQPLEACQELLHLPSGYDFTTSPHHLLLVTDLPE